MGLSVWRGLSRSSRRPAFCSGRCLDLKPDTRTESWLQTIRSRIELSIPSSHQGFHSPAPRFLRRTTFMVFTPHLLHSSPCSTSHTFQDTLLSPGFLYCCSLCPECSSPRRKLTFFFEQVQYVQQSYQYVTCLLGEF